MSEMLGADVAELRALAKEFSGKAQSLTQAQRLIDGAVNQLPRYWQGPDAQRFASRWRGQHRGILSRTATMLDETAQQLKINATEQEQASSVASLSGPSGVPSGNKGDGGDKPFWEYDPNGNWFDNYVKRPWDIYKFVPDTLTTARNIAFTGDLLLHAKDLKAAWGTPGAVSAFLDTRWFNMGPTTKFLNNGAELLQSGKFAESLATSPGMASALKGLGTGLGWAGVGIDAVSGINKMAHGNFIGEGYRDGDLGGNIKAATDSGAADLVRAGIGAAALIPGPQQPFAIVAAGAIAIYDNWDKIEAGAQWLGENGPKAIEAANDFANDTAKNTVDAVSDVVKDPGKLLPWNW
ncbi:WXG100 family type VII secretion target [Arthrobacter sp. HLT1-20]